VTGRLGMAPASDAHAWPNFEHSVRRGVEPAAFAGLSTEQQQLVGKHARRGRVRMWGSRENKDAVWNEVRRDDVLLFYAKDRFVASGVVSGKVRDPEIADAVWEPVPGTWHNVLFLDRVQKLSLPPRSVGAALGYKPRWYPREFYFPQSGPQARVLAAYGTVAEFLASMNGESSLGLGDSYANALGAVETPADIDRILARLKARDTDDIPETTTTATKRIRRDAQIVLELKRLYEGHCQVCDDTFATTNGTNYCEAAHIVPIEQRLPGIDTYRNIVILCATCHRKLDHGGMRIFWDAAKQQALFAWNGRRRPLKRNLHIHTGWSPTPA
jgi:hypothetical protein